MSFRVVRLLEYVYDTAEEMVKDREGWQVSDATSFNKHTVIRSAVLAPEIWEDDIKPTLVRPA